MKLIRIAFVFATVLFVLSLAAACKGLALSGEKRYKVEVASHTTSIEREINDNGAVSDQAVKKLQKIMDKWRDEMGKKGSFARLETIMSLINEAKENPANEYRKNQECLMEINELRETLKTEVQD